MSRDKPPPHDLDAEMAALGCALLSPQAVEKIIERLTAEMFYHGWLKQIAEIIIDLKTRAVTVDFNTVAEQLRSANAAESAGRLTDLIDRVAAPEHVDDYIRTVYEKHILRQTLAEAHTTLKDCQSPLNAPEAIEDAERRQITLGDEFRAWNFQIAPPDITRKVSLRVTEERMKRRAGESLTFSWGLDRLDKAAELRSGNLYLIVGDANHLKSSLVIHALASMMGDRKCLVLPFEEGTEGWYEKLLARVAAVSIEKVSRGEELTDQELERVELADKAIVESGNLILPDLRAIKSTASIQRFIDLYQPDLIVVDYLQIFPDDRGIKRATERLDTISEELQRMAAIENVCIIVISSINREYTDGMGRPTMNSVRNSHAAVHANHAMIGTFYPHKCKQDEPPWFVELSVLKHKTSGSTRWKAVGVDPATFWFCDQYVTGREIHQPLPKPKQEELPIEEQNEQEEPPF